MVLVIGINYLIFHKTELHLCSSVIVEDTLMVVGSASIQLDEAATE